jgi:hypothetical protein
MLMLCDKCNVQGDCRLDKESSKVICPNCGGQVETITPFLVNAMKATRDYIAPSKQGFAFMCPCCAKKQPSVVRRDGKSVICKECKTELPQVSSFMLSTMRNMEIYEE